MRNSTPLKEVKYHKKIEFIMSSDNLIGISGYSSKDSGFTGEIKYNADSFIVNEIPERMQKNQTGKYTILKIKLTNWDTNKFIIYLSDYLHISNKRITYAGTKDKTGITTQYFCINLPDDSINFKNINIKDAEFLDVFKSDHMLKLGDLRGNEFIIKIMSSKNNNDKILRIYNEIMNNGGFPNFFGYQRFGNIRVNTHRIGKLIVTGKYEEAVKLYLYDSEFDHEDYRINFDKTGDAKKALSEFPSYLSFERSLLGYILEHKTYANAFSIFPKNLSMLFVHAYQSYIFNRILSERMKITDNLFQVMEGDCALPLDEYFNPDKTEIIHATKYNLEKLNALSRNNKLRPAIPLIGYKSELSSGVEGEIENRILESENISRKNFYINGFKNLSSSGDFRIISAMPRNFNIVDENTLKFELGKGIYAVSFLREFIKK